MLKNIKRPLAILTVIAVIFTLSLAYSPIAQATSTTCSPEPNVETVSVDGRITNSDSDFATARNALAGTSANDSASIMNVGVHNTAGTYFFYRSIVLVDCSAIPDGDTVCSATLTLVSDVTRSVPGAQNYVVVVGASNPATNTAIIAADYDMAGSTTMSNSVDYSTWANGASAVFTLNAAGLANISKTGVSKFGLKNGYDVDNVTIANETENVIDIRSADYAGTGSDPVLAVTSQAGGCGDSGPITIIVTYYYKPDPILSNS